MHSTIKHRKHMGVHYTPALLAEFLADRIVRWIRPTPKSSIRILDPACGDGALLEAILKVITVASPLQGCKVMGVETDPAAIAAAKTRLSAFEGLRPRLIERDFLDLAGAEQDRSTLWGDSVSSGELDGAFDVVIANPPYVRTQVLGAERARRLANRYGLSGRVDLYQAFFVAVAGVLKPGGLMGILTSNRFLSTLTGRAVRGFLARQFDILELIDLGDTKLFEAAVLPALLVCRRRPSPSTVNASHCPRFIRIYSDSGPDSKTITTSGTKTSVMDLLKKGEAGIYRTCEGVFRLTTGDLALGRDPTQVWRLTTTEETDWLQKVRAATCGNFEDVACVRVGVKTTADAVFVRDDWDTMPEYARPEPELMHPLLTHEDARQWSRASSRSPTVSILYPHEVVDGRRRPVDLTRFPRAKAYLELHRKRLEKRRYVLEAGRQWYEIWVPQDPAGWSAPKIVFPDISPEPRFYLDEGGGLVDGGCYWITLRPGLPADMLYLLLAIANSAMAERFHDLAFNNKLYSGRRRYITQYVSQYPLPDPESRVTRELITAVKELCRRAAAQEADRCREIVPALNVLVETAFGLH